MTSPDPRVVAARIKAETGIDVLDGSADAAAATAATRQVWRQVAGTLSAGLVGALALLCVVLAFVPGNGGDTASMGLRAAFAIVGAMLVAVGTALIVWAWRTPAAYTELYVKRQLAKQRFFTETGQPWPSPFADGDWLTRKAMIAYSTPGQVRAMRKEAASRQSPPQNQEKI